jgi:two-component system OmpR family sensor kinase
VACGRDKAATLGWVEVRDHGCGVPEDARERVFEPFWRSGDTGPGTGLGLAIVREIVVAHGGTVQMMPRTGEAGTIFRIELPAA